MTSAPAQTGYAAVNGLNPVLLVFGDADSMPPTHMARFFELLGGGKADAGWDGSNMPRSRLAILPATTHYNIFSSPALVPIVAAFLSDTRDAHE